MNKKNTEIQKDNISNDIATEIHNLKNLIIKEKAENENLRKRFRKEIEETRKFAISNFVKYFTEQIENLFRALDNIDIQSCKSNPELRILFEGVNMTKKNLLKIFINFNIKRIYPLYSIFNYKL